nr:response regulator [uncultured Carboxylicivirga sp.]
MKKVLLVEDSLVTRLFLKDLLSPYKVEIEECDNGLDALSLIALQSHSLIIMDLLMPKMTGIEVLSHLRKNKCKNYPIVILSADIQKPTRIQCLDLGALAFLSKPIDEEEIINLFEELLKD